MPFGNPDAYPIPDEGGPQYLKIHQFQPAYEEITDKHVYEDGGVSFVTFNDSAPIRWVIEYDGLSEADVAILDGHRADAFGEVFGFEFTHPRTEQEFTGVHYDEAFEEDHRKTWNNRRVIHLIKRPA